MANPLIRIFNSNIHFKVTAIVSNAYCYSKIINNVSSWLFIFIVCWITFCKYYKLISYYYRSHQGFKTSIILNSSYWRSFLIVQSMKGFPSEFIFQNRIHLKFRQSLKDISKTKVTYCRLPLVPWGWMPPHLWGGHLYTQNNHRNRYKYGYKAKHILWNFINRAILWYLQ